MCVQIPPAGSNVFDPWYPSYPLVEGVNSLGLIMNYCYPFLLCSLGPLQGELMALVYYLTNRNKMLAASGRHPRLQKLKSSTSAPQRQPLRMNAAACFCNRSSKCALKPTDSWLLSDHKCCPSCPALGSSLWEVARLTFPAYPSDTVHLHEQHHRKLPGDSQHVAPLLSQKKPSVVAGVTPEWQFRLGDCYLTSVLLWQATFTGCTIHRASWVSHVGQVPLFRYSTRFFQLPGKRNVFGGVNNFDNSSVVC